MIKKLWQLILMAACVVALAAWPATATGQSDLTLFVTGVHTDAFPDVELDLRATNENNQVVNNLTNDSLEVSEAGTPVKDFKLTPNNNGAVRWVYVLDLDVYSSLTYAPGLTDMQAAFSTLVTGGYFVDDRDTVQVEARINKNSDQTVELLPPTHKGVDLTKWAQGFDFKGGSGYTNGLLGVDETIKELAGETPGPVAQTTAIIYVGRRIASLPATVASSAATGYAQEAKDAHILLYAFHTGGQNDSAGALNTLANGSGGAYVRLQRGSVAATVSGVYGSLNAQRTQYTLAYRSVSGASGKREIKVAPAGAPTNGPETVTASYDITVQGPVIKITVPTAGATVERTAGGGSQKVKVMANVDAWPDGHPRQLKQGVFTVNGQMAGQLQAPTQPGIYEFDWDISGITQPGKHTMALQVTVTDELGQQATANDSVTVDVPEAPSQATAGPTTPGQTTEATPDPCVVNPAACAQGGGGGVPTGWIALGIGLFLVMAGALVVLFIMVMRMRRPAAAAAAPARQYEEGGGSETILVESARPQVTLGQIKILQGPPDMMGRTIDISRPTTVMGRAPQGSDIVFYADDERSVISRRHCSIDCDGMSFTITDHSANGTSINGVRIQRDMPTQLDDGADVQLGAADQMGVRFTFSNMIGKTQLWTPSGSSGGARGGEGATMMKADLGPMPGPGASSRPPAAAAAARTGGGRIAPWVIIAAVAAALVMLLACAGFVGVAWYLISSSRQAPLLPQSMLTPALSSIMALAANLQRTTL